MVWPPLPRILLLAATTAAGAMSGVATACAETKPAASDTLKIVSVDARSLPARPEPQAEAPSTQWRTSFGSERRSQPARPKPAAGIDADIVLLQGVTDVRALRAWFPAGVWRVITSPQLFASGTEPSDENPTVAKVPYPATAVAVRLRPGLRITARDHMPEVAGAMAEAPSGAAATAARIRFENRETWAISVTLPDTCASDCPARAALDRWHEERGAENVRRVTGGDFAPGKSAGGACGDAGLRLDPPPPPPRPSFIPSSLTPEMGCAATVSVAK